MQFIIKKATIIDRNSPFHQKVKDLRIINGIITDIEDDIKVGKERIIDAHNLHISVGWVDFGAQFGEPGYEHRETLATGMRAAAQGGFTEVIISPDTAPPLENKAQIDSILYNTEQSPVTVHPMGALSKQLAGEEMAELAELADAGAVCFSQGNLPIQNPNLLLTALEYAKNFDGLVINRPEDTHLASDGIMHEGPKSVLFGLKGIATLAEVSSIKKNIDLVAYSNTQIHLHKISSRAGLEVIKDAKNKGIKVTSSVSINNLIFTDDALTQYDSQYKFTPPARSINDQDALLKGLKSGDIEMVVSDHTPWEIEAKRVELAHAQSGSIGLESFFGVIRKKTANSLSIAELVDILTTRPRKVLDLPLPIIDVSNIANLTLFNPDQEYPFTQRLIASKSKNTPFLNETLLGKVVGIFNNNQYAKAK